MLKLLIIYFLTPIFMLTSVSLSHAGSHAVRVSADPWEAFIIGNEGESPTGGYGPEITKEIFKRLGIEYEIMIYPYERCLLQMQSGERDMLLLVKKTPEREKYMLYSVAAVSDPQLLYYSTNVVGNFEINHWSELKGYTVGGINSFNYGEFGKYIEEIGTTFDLVDTDTQNLKKLLSGRVDFIILNRSSAMWFEKQNPKYRGKIKAVSMAIDESEFYFALSKKGKATALLPKINEVLTAMKADGSMDKILDVYN